MININANSRCGSGVIDYGLAATDYGRYRADFPDRTFAELRRCGIGLPGQRLVDVGSGTGALARGFARGGARVTAVDISQELMAVGRARAVREAVAELIDWRCAHAEDTGLPSRSCDVVTAGQCWHWFDRPAAAAEARRLLRPGGRLVIAHFDFLDYPGNVVDATLDLVAELNGQDAAKILRPRNRGVHRRWFDDLVHGGFVGLTSFTFDVETPYTIESWTGRMRASAGVCARAGTSSTLEKFNQLLPERLAPFLRGGGAASPLFVPHRIFVLVGVRPDSSEVSP